MITGAHAVLHSRNAEADRAFFRDVLGLANVDVGGGWLIFALPPSEIAFHPGEKNDHHQLYLLTDDIEAFAYAMAARGHSCTARKDEGWGVTTELPLPGGGTLGVYQPLHARPPAVLVAEGTARKPRAPKKSAKKAGKLSKKPAPSKKRKTKRR